jgi:DNA-binding NarL/FixJ family response regulator
VPSCNAQKAIAIDTKSVETYRSCALEKLGSKTRAEIVRFALLEGWMTRSAKSP